MGIGGCHHEGQRRTITTILILIIVSIIIATATTPKNPHRTYLRFVNVRLSLIAAATAFTPSSPNLLSSRLEKTRYGRKVKRNPRPPQALADLLTSRTPIARVSTETKACLFVIPIVVHGASKVLITLSRLYIPGSTGTQ